MKTKKFLAILLTLAMCLGMLPGMALADNYVAQVGDDKYETIEEAIVEGQTTYSLEEDTKYTAQIVRNDAAVGSYETLQAAINAAQSGDTITIGTAGTYTLPIIPRNITIKGSVDGVVFVHTSAGNVADVKSGATFENVSFIFGSENYHGFQHAGKIVMKNCTINGKFFSYGDMEFDNCKFNQTDSDYHMWCYSGNIRYNECVFTNDATGKFLNIYNEGGTTKYTVDVVNCKFINGGSSNKAALNVKATCGDKQLQFDVTVDASSTTEGEFPAASTSGALVVISPLVQVDDIGEGGASGITVSLNGKQVYPEAAALTVAQIGTTEYETLEEAFGAAQDGDTITLLADCAGNGIKAPQGKFNTTGLTVDFAGFTYTVNGETLAGSTGTKTQAFQLLKGNTITFQNGAIVGDNADVKMLIQNYSNLTLDGMTLDATVGNNSLTYVVSNNNGDIVIKDSTLIARTGYNAFDVCVTNYYPDGARVTVEGDSVISGKIEYGIWGTPPAKNKTALTITGGTFAGGFAVDTALAEAAIDKFSITGGTFNYDPSAYVDEGYVANNNGDNTWTVIPANSVAMIAGKGGYATLAAAVAAVDDDETITLLEDSSGAKIDNGKRFTIDLNKKKLTSGFSLYRGFVTLDNGVVNGGVWVYSGESNTTPYNSLTIADDAEISASYAVVFSNQSSSTKAYGSTINVNGKLKGNLWVMGNITEGNSEINVTGTVDATDKSDVGIALNGFATLNVSEGANVKSDSTGIEVRAGNLNVSGGTIIGTGRPSSITPNGSGTTSEAAGIAVSTYDISAISVNISGGMISGYSPLYLANTVTMVKDFAMSVTGGTFTVTNALVNENPAAVAMYEGGAETRAVKFISGGMFSTEPNASYIAEGLVTKRVDGMYTVGEPVAAIGTTQYATLEEAFAAAKDGETITLLADCSGNGIKAPQGKFNTTGLTVDFGGHTYTVDGTLVGSTGTETQAFQLLKDNKITFRSGTLYSEKAKMLVQNYSNLTLDKMTLTLNNQNYTYPAYTLSNNNGSATIKDTTINANNENSFAFDVCRYASYPSVYVEVKGNSTINGDVEVDASNSDPKNGFSLKLTGGTMNGTINLTNGAKAAIAADTTDKAVVTKDSNFALDAPTGYAWDTNGKLVAVDYVARIGEKGYETLKAAIEAATNGQTVTLLKDTNGGYDISGKSITLDLNGQTLTLGPSVGSTNTETSGIRVLAGAGLTIKNGNLYVSNIRNAKYKGNTEKPYAGYVKVALANYGTMVIEDVTMKQDASDSRLIWAVSNRGDLTIKGNTTIPNGTNPYKEQEQGDNAGLTRAAINMTPYDYANVNATLTVNSAGVTVGDIVINDESNPKSHGFTQDRTISLNISAGQYGEIKQINTYDGVTVTKSITGGVYSTAPAEAYIATGFAVADNSDTGYPYKVALNSVFESGTELETTGSTNKEVEGNTTTTTTTDFGTVEAGAYVIQIETKVETTGEETQTTTEYKPVTTEVTTDVVESTPAVTNNTNATNEQVAAAQENVVSSVTTNAAAATFKAALAQNETSTQEQVLQTKAAAKAIAKAAAKPTVNAAEIATVKIELKTELKSYELAQGSNDSIVSDKVTYDIKPVAVLYNSSDVKIGDAVELDNSDIQTGESYTFSIPVPSNMGVSADDTIKVTHTDSDNHVETYLLPVKADNSSKLYVEVTVNHFSTFELAKQNEGNFNDILFAKSISLQDSIACNYYVYLPVTGGYDASKVSVTSTFKGAGTTINGVACDTETINKTNYIPYRFVVADAAAKEMTEKISVVVKYDGMVIKTVDWSVRSYCQGLINDANESASHNIAKATLDYGADAQKYFNYKASDLATSNNNNANYLSPVDFTEPASTRKSGVATDVSATVSRSLVTTSKTQLNVYFVLSQDSGNYNITVEKGGVALTKTRDYVVDGSLQNGSQICVTIKGIAAPDLDNRYTVTIKNYSDNSSFSYELSPLNYLWKNRESAAKPNGVGTLGSLCQTMYNYYHYAEAYFPNN